MTLAELTAALDAQGVRLPARLVVDAPAGVLTAELHDALAAHKPLLLQRVVREMVWAELSTWRWGSAPTDDGAPGIDNPGRPFNHGTFARAMADGADPYTAAEREAIQTESDPGPGEAP
jgi:hypothetical protein